MVTVIAVVVCYLLLATVAALVLAVLRELTFLRAELAVVRDALMRPDMPSSVGQPIPPQVSRLLRNRSSGGQSAYTLAFLSSSSSSSPEYARRLIEAVHAHSVDVGAISVILPGRDERSPLSESLRSAGVHMIHDPGASLAALLDVRGVPTTLDLSFESNSVTARATGVDVPLLMAVTSNVYEFKRPRVEGH